MYSDSYPDEQLSEPAGSSKIIIFDGDCNLCNFFIGRILKYRPDPPFEMISSVSKAGRNLIRQYNLQTSSLSSVIYIHGKDIYLKSEAIIRISRQLGGGWKVLVLMKWLPKSLREFLYMLIATNRYRLFGKRTTCEFDPDSHDN